MRTQFAQDALAIIGAVTVAATAVGLAGLAIAAAVEVERHTRTARRRLTLATVRP